MKADFVLFTLIVIILCISNSAFGLASWCKEQWQGFSLDEDYNPNSPPTKEFILLDTHVLHKVDEVDDITHQIQITMYETYAWTDPRIHVNHSHHFWKGINEKSKNTIRLFGLFVERCLWTPRLNFLNAVEDSESNTGSISSSSNHNMEPYLSSYPKRDPHPRIVISSLQMKVHINCNMRFDRFPFDEQICEVGRILVSPFYHHDEKIDWKIKGRLETNFETLSRESGQYGQKELQYVITGLYEMSETENMTIGKVAVPMFTWKIEMERILMPYIVKSFIPTTLIVMVSWTSFLVSPDCVPGRSGLLVTLLLVLITIYLHDLDVSPSIHGITPLIIWNQICLTMVIIALFEYAGIMYVIRFLSTSNKINGMICLNLETRRKDFCQRDMECNNSMTKIKVEGNSSKSKDGDNEKSVAIKKDSVMEARFRMAKSIDHASLIFIPVLFALTTLVYWLRFAV